MTVSAPVSTLERLLLDAVPLCVLAGADHTFERVNDRFRGAFPHRRLDGVAFRDAFPELADTEIYWVLDAVFATGEPAVANEVRALDPHGGEIAYNFLLQPIRTNDGDVIGLLAIGVDVTAQVTARQRVEALERRSAFLAEASATLAASLEPAETLATVAHLAVHHFADWCSVDVVVEAGIGDGTVAAADPELEDYLAEIQHRYRPHRESGCLPGRALATGEPQMLGEDEPFAVPREPRHAELLAHIQPRAAFAVPLKARGQTLGVLTLAWVKPGRTYGHDERGLADEFARHAAIAVDNARLYREAQAAVQVREEFLGIAGHELKTPLTALKLQLQSLQRAAERPNPPRLDQLGDRLQRMAHQIGRLERLMSDLLDVSMVTAGRLALRRERVDLRNIVFEVVARQQENLIESGSALSVDAPSPILGLFDPERIDQVIQNLVTNAIKYGRGQPIEVSAQVRGAFARITVQDHGIGIAPEAQSRIFGRFERAVSDRHYGGFGLGLWIVRQIVDATGGRIWFESVQGEGATFVVELPLEP